MKEERPHTNGSNGSAESGPGDGAKIGDVLARAREERGLSLQEVEQETKIRKRYLSGLEREDFSTLPDSVYVQGFLKTYANFLGLDGEELARDLKRRRGRRRDQRQPGVGEIKKSGFDRPVLGPGGLSQAQGRKVSSATLFTLLVAVLVLTAVVGALYFVGRDTQTAGQAPSGGADNPPAGQAPSGGGGNSGPPAEGGAANEGAEGGSEAGNEGGGRAAGSGADGELASGAGGAGSGSLAVTVSVEGADSWLSVSSDGAVAYEQIAPPGFSQTFEAEEDVLLSTGNAGALRVEVNGQDIGPVGEAGEVLERGFTLKDAG